MGTKKALTGKPATLGDMLRRLIVRTASQLQPDQSQLSECPPGEHADRLCRGAPAAGLDGAGWVTFDVTSIQCPVTVLHGGSDRMVDVIHAHHTAAVVPAAELVVFDDLGHFSIVTKVVPAISNLLQR